MELAVRKLLVGFNPEITSQKQRINFNARFLCSRSQRTTFNVRIGYFSQVCHRRSCHRSLAMACVASQGLQECNIDKFPFKDFTVSANSCGDGEIKMRINVLGAKTQTIFDDVFSKLVEAAQPIPGFRRVKGGKTPDIPKEVLMHILGPSKVYKQSIKKIINSTVAEYVEKEGLKVTKDLRVQQSFEELEATFVPGKEFSFDAIIHLQEGN